MTHRISLAARAEANSGLGALSETRQEVHDRAVGDIARERFAYPAREQRDFRTYPNRPKESMAVQLLDGSIAYPDIVVVQQPGNYAKILGEVEVAETISEETAVSRWLAFSGAATLYVYVPAGKGDEALALCRRHNIPVVGIRTWRYLAGHEQIEITDHYTVPNKPEEILPKFFLPGD